MPSTAGRTHLTETPWQGTQLNALGNIWQFMRENWLSNRVFNSYEEIVALSCDAWNKLTDQPRTIMSMRLHNRAHRF
jgi:hypothetical protein